MDRAIRGDVQKGKSTGAEQERKERREEHRPPDRHQEFSPASCTRLMLHLSDAKDGLLSVAQLMMVCNRLRRPESKLQLQAPRPSDETSPNRQVLVGIA